jgi:hypothetical protein
MPSQLLAFAWRHKWHALLVPFAAVTLITLGHELGHAAMVWLQGGTVLELSIIPAPGELGHIAYRLPPGGDRALVAFGPVLCWSALAGLTAAFGMLAGRLWGPLARTLFVWGYCVPLADIAWSAGPWLLGEDNDLLYALGRPDPLWLIAWGSCFAAALVVGFALQRRLYGPDAL